MIPQDLPDNESAPHRPTTTERGSFTLAHCPCGWSGPARRSRERARTDASSHTSPSATTTG
ncbi:hypothetical protein NBG84_39550 [Streptomyces sp. CWNU-1]|uniref:Uncharacterized protein n=1 Tax=Streptomyces albipurpureus TaxID=2897419 RepID=A0ABT0V265_9ACTN|nr:hypothetical protein [Streptomyces sp. CWNU-1]MCM2394299.1 hypothetical protein [Streptomyces sp. CWNU-1]